MNIGASEPCLSSHDQTSSFGTTRPGRVRALVMFSRSRSRWSLTVVTHIVRVRAYKTVSAVPHRASAGLDYARCAVLHAERGVPWAGQYQAPAITARFAERTGPGPMSA